MHPAATARLRPAPALPRQLAPLSRRDPLPPILGQWRLVRRIAASEHAALYEAQPAARPADSPADYLVKVAGSSAIAAALVRREKAVAEGVRHPHLAAVLEGNLSGEPAFLVFPNAGAPLEISSWNSVRSALWKVRQLAAALAALHAVGWVHARLTPQAVLLSPRGHVTLGELGWARRISTEECRGEHLLAADLRYVAPETLSEGTSLTPACDVYALGLLLIEWLTGRPAVNANIGSQAALAQLRGTLADVGKERVDVPPEVVALLARMTRREPLRRPSAAQVERQLVRLELSQLSGRGARASLPRWR